MLTKHDITTCKDRAGAGVFHERSKVTQRQREYFKLINSKQHIMSSIQQYKGNQTLQTHKMKHKIGAGVGQFREQFFIYLLL